MCCLLGWDSTWSWKEWRPLTTREPALVCVLRLRCLVCGCGDAYLLNDLGPLGLERLPSQVDSATRRRKAPSFAHADRPAVRAVDCAQGSDIPHLTVRAHGDSRGYISTLFLDHQLIWHAPSPSRIRDDTTSLHRTFVHIKTPAWGLESEHVGSGWGGLHPKSLLVITKTC